MLNQKTTVPLDPFPQNSTRGHASLRDQDSKKIQSILTHPPSSLELANSKTIIGVANIVKVVEI